MKIRKRNKILAAAFLICFFLLGTALAYLLDKDEKDNVFTVGEISIGINEPAFDREDAQDLRPGKMTLKDPRIENMGSSDAYVFMQVEIPVREIYVVGEDELLTKKKAALFELYDMSPSFSLLEEKTDEKALKCLYVYGSKERPSVLKAGDESEALFSKAGFVNALEGELDGQKINISVKAYGIQAEGVNGKSADEIFDILMTQLDTAPRQEEEE